MSAGPPIEGNDNRGWGPVRNVGVVACCLVHGSRIGLLRRGVGVQTDRGKWHCVTGFLPRGVDPLRQALAELHEETGLTADNLELLRRPRPLIRGAAGRTWVVYPFLFRSCSPRLCLNWENSDYRWLPPADIPTLNHVSWLIDVLTALEIGVLGGDGAISHGIAALEPAPGSNGGKATAAGRARASDLISPGSGGPGRA